MSVCKYQSAKVKGLQTFISKDLMRKPHKDNIFMNTE